MDVFERDVGRTERGALLRQALRTSTKGLLLDERFILQRLEHALLKMEPAAAVKLGVFLTVTVADFAAHFGSTFDAARRHLRDASRSIVRRVVNCQWPDGSWALVAWVDETAEGADEVRLHFTATFLKIFLAEVAPPVIGEARPSIFSSVSVSKPRRGSPRPRGMTLDEVVMRIRKRLKLVMSASETHCAFIVFEDSPWRGKDDPLRHRYTQRDLHVIYQWVLRTLSKQGLLPQRK